MAENKVLVFASFRPKTGQEQEVETILRAMVAPTRSEPGNECYDLYKRKTDGDGETSYHLIEKYSDGVALQAHRDSEHYKNYRSTIGDYLAEPIGVIVLESVDTAD